MHKKFLSDRPVENKKEVRDTETELMFELRRWEIKAIDKTVKDLKDTDRQHNCKIHVGRTAPHLSVELPGASEDFVKNVLRMRSLF